jgi:anti-sigma factor RsiW
MVHWTDRGMAFWAISDLNAAELKTFSERFSAN